MFVVSLRDSSENPFLRHEKKIEANSPTLAAAAWDRPSKITLKKMCFKL